MAVTMEKDSFIKLLHKIKDSDDHRERDNIPIINNRGHCCIKVQQMGWVHCRDVSEECLKEEGIEYYKGDVEGER
jgi:hypothetical protein